MSTKSNYTVTIGKVLMEWLGGKGLSPTFVSVDRYDSPHVGYFVAWSGLGHPAEFTQSELDANDDRRNEMLKIGQLVMFIRAELEGQTQSRNGSFQEGAE